MTNQPVNPVEQRHKKLANTLYHLFRQTQEPFTVETIAQLIANAKPATVMPESLKEAVSQLKEQFISGPSLLEVVTVYKVPLETLLTFCQSAAEQLAEKDREKKKLQDICKDHSRMAAKYREERDSLGGDQAALREELRGPMARIEKREEER
jgi:tRNA(Met) C34 N-acetyltransferase TmcA